jgi:hypothetical protein
VRRCRGSTLSVPCLQTLWNGSGLCTYHEKIAGGLLEPSEPSLRPPGWRQARRPKIAIIGDGWAPADALSPDVLVDRPAAHPARAGHGAGARGHRDLGKPEGPGEAEGPLGPGKPKGR